MESGSNDPFAEWFVDMIQASENMTDAELERVVSEADPAIAPATMKTSPFETVQWKVKYSSR